MIDDLKYQERDESKDQEIDDLKYQVESLIWETKEEKKIEISINFLQESVSTLEETLSSLRNQIEILRLKLGSHIVKDEKYFGMKKREEEIKILTLRGENTLELLRCYTKFLVQRLMETK